MAACCCCFLAWALAYIGKAILLSARQHVFDSRQGPFKSRKAKPINMEVVLFFFSCFPLPAEGLRLPLVIV